MERPHHISLRELLQAWNIQAKRIEPVLDVYKVHSDLGPKAFKGCGLTPDAMRFIHSIFHHLKAQEFNAIMNAIPTSDGQDFIVSEGMVFALYDWIEGRRPKFQHTEELSDACKTMAYLHKAGLGYHPPPGLRPRRRWGRLVKSQKKHRQDLADFAEKAGNKRYKTRFDRDYLHHLPEYLELASRSIERLSTEEYRTLVREYKRMGCFCHGDVAERNFVRGLDGVTYLIDLDSARLDLPVMDLVKFTRRVLKKARWNPAVAQTIIAAYQEVLPLRPEEIHLFGALMTFPQKFWRIADRYYHKTKFFSEEKAYHKLQNVLRQKEAFIRFIKAYDENGNEWWGSKG